MDAQVAEAVEELKALKVSLTALEEQMEALTGIPRNKEAFREAVVRSALLLCCWRCHPFSCVAGTGTPSPVLLALAPLFL